MLPCLLILIANLLLLSRNQNPIFSNQSSYAVFAHVMKRIVSMSSSDHKLLIHWFATIDAARFRLLVRRLLQFITIREFPPANGVKLPPVTKSRWWIPSATRILALLYASNFQVYPSIINYTEFYNSALDHINLMSEYHKWQNPTSASRGGSRFSYCQYPFILSIVAKKMILQKDSEQQMILNARVSLCPPLSVHDFVLTPKYIFECVSIPFRTILPPKIAFSIRRLSSISFCAIPYFAIRLSNTLTFCSILSISFTLSHVLCMMDSPSCLGFAKLSREQPPTHKLTAGVSQIRVI